MLVCKDWTELSTEFLYESILVDLYGLTGIERLVDILQTPGRGSQLAWWVKRLDMNSSIKVHVLTIQKLCPNLRILRMFSVDSHTRARYLEHIPFLHPESHLTTLSVTPITLKAILEAAPSTLVHWRFLTIIIDDLATGSGTSTVPILPPLPQLLSLTVVWNATASLVPIGSWSCPLLTHLSIHFWDEFEDVSTLVEHFGPQLTFFAFTGTGSCITRQRLHSFLKAMPKLKELVTPQLSERVTPADQDPLWEFTHSEVELLGFPITPSDVGDRSAEYAQSAHFLFPKLRAIRITNAQKAYTVAHCRENPASDRLKDLQSFARVLERLGVVLEDPTGEDARQYILEGGMMPTKNALGVGKIRSIKVG